MAKKRKIIKMTLNDFKSWFLGFCDCRSDDWTPDSDQWDMIQERVFNIIEQSPTTRTVIPAVQNSNKQHFELPVLNTPSNSSLAVGGNSSMPKSNIPQGHKAPKVYRDNNGMKVIDTSDGVIKSEYE